MSSFINFLKRESQKLCITIDDKTLTLFDNFRRDLIGENKRTNLTRIVSEEEFAKKHILDSLMIITHLDIKEGSSLIDVGTGPGIPGLVLKIYRPDLKLVLLEAQGKKTDFIQKAVSRLDLTGVQVINDRAEIVARQEAYREKFDVVVARAVSALNVLSELCLPFTKIGGMFVAMKGDEPEREIQEAEQALEVLGGKVKDVIYYNLEENLKRSLITINKEEPCPDKYPRRPGIPEKRPI